MRWVLHLSLFALILIASPVRAQLPATPMVPNVSDVSLRVLEPAGGNPLRIGVQACLTMPGPVDAVSTRVEVGYGLLSQNEARLIRTDGQVLRFDPQAAICPMPHSFVTATEIQIDRRDLGAVGHQVLIRLTVNCLKITDHCPHRERTYSLVRPASLARGGT